MKPLLKTVDLIIGDTWPERRLAASCRECNHGFALDEQYMACLLECVIVGESGNTSGARWPGDGPA